MNRTIKSDFGREPYIDLVNDARYRIAITKMRSSSHSLEIERGRHTNPKTPIQLCVCLFCKEVQDEKHFVLYCKKNEIERLEIFQKISGWHEDFINLTSDEKYYYLFTNPDPNLGHISFHFCPLCQNCYKIVFFIYVIRCDMPCTRIMLGFTLYNFDNEYPFIVIVIVIIVHIFCLGLESFCIGH